MGIFAFHDSNIGGEVNLKEELAKVQARKQSVVTELQQVKQKEQELSNEYLRLEGEERALKRMDQ